MSDKALNGSGRVSRIVGFTIAFLTLVFTAINGIPAYLALKGRQAAVVFQTSKSTMGYPAGADQGRVRELLQKNDLPDTFTKLSLANRGDQPAEEVIVTLRVPGRIVAVNLQPAVDREKVAWVSLVENTVADESKNQLRIALKRLALGPILSVDVSYTSSGSDEPQWELFSDGRSGIPVSSVADQPPNVNSVPFRPIGRILLIGLVTSLVAFITIRSFENSTFRDAVSIVLRSLIPFGALFQFGPPASQRRWAAYKNEVILALASRPGVELQSVADGTLTTIEPAQFWDARLRFGGNEFGLDVQSSAQGLFTASAAVQESYCLRMIAMAQRESRVAVIVYDATFSSLSSEWRVGEILESVRRTNPAFRFLLLHGTPDEVAGEFTRVAVSPNSTTEGTTACTLT